MIAVAGMVEDVDSVPDLCAPVSLKGGSELDDVVGKAPEPKKLVAPPVALAELTPEAAYPEPYAVP